MNDILAGLFALASCIAIMIWPTLLWAYYVSPRKQAMFLRQLCLAGGVFYAIVLVMVLSLKT